VHRTLGSDDRQGRRGPGVTRQRVDRLALRLEAVFGGEAQTWLAMQTAYELAQAKQRTAQTTAGLRRIVGAAQPGE
jgi:plasmid maintenance system antidote protein VapI